MHAPLARTDRKTTTLGMLTGDLQPSGGQAFIAGLPLSDPRTRRLIGFCPQTDPLLDLMTGWETLWFFGRVRGVCPGRLRRRCGDLVQQVGLESHAHKPCGTYSGGNKRKLSLAVVSGCPIYRCYLFMIDCVLVDQREL
jgi:ATP-binding cassette, subfamily A (ABC1), member 3